MSTPTPGGFSLFPSPNSSKPPPILRNGTPKPRRSESMSRNADTIIASPESSEPAFPFPTSSSRNYHNRNHSNNSNERETPQAQAHAFSPVESAPPPAAATSSRQPQHHNVQQPRPAGDVPGRTETAFSQANTLVRSPSGLSRSSIAKLPLNDEPPAFEQPVRSIFPTYNPDLPLNQQEYAPTQMSPTHIPRAVISRQTYYESNGPQSPPFLSPVRSPLRSPMSINQGTGQWPRVVSETPVIPTTSTNDELKSLWKVVNGWQASPSEGRVYCMKLTQEKDAPVYTFSSASQPFYNLRLDPTSASAYVTLTRHDPAKVYKVPSPSASATSIISDIVHGNKDSSSSVASSVNTGGKHWHEALSTVLEEESRKHPPNDGLVSLLMPSAAAKAAVERAHDMQAVMMAERECARLVWDEDSAQHFLVHPALATPFCVTIERSPSWSRVEYTLEHNESPKHIAKLTRDGTGSGWLELDTGIASKIESYYIVDVAVTALMLVAAGDEKNMPAVADLFEPPPPVLLSGKDERRLSKQSKREEKKRRKMETFEIDIESQNDSLGKTKKKTKDSDDKLPFLIRVIVKLAKGVFKLIIWVLTVAFKCVLGVGKLFYKCVGSKY